MDNSSRKSWLSRGSFTLAMCFMVVISSGCSIFSPREAEEPGGSQGFFQQPDRPDVVLSNLQNAIENVNLQNYLSSLNREEFRFQASEQAQTSDPLIWDSWGYDQEQIYFNNLRSAAENLSGHRLQLSDRIDENISVNEIRITISYSITVNHNRSGTPNIGVGRMILNLVADANGLWSITAWSDIGNGEDFTWSQFRAVFFRG